MEIETLKKLLEINTKESQREIAFYLQNLQTSDAPLENAAVFLTILSHPNSIPCLIAAVIHLSGLLHKEQRLNYEQLITLKSHIRSFLADYILNMSANEFSMAIWGANKLKIRSIPSLQGTLNNNLSKVLMLTVDQMSPQQLATNFCCLSFLGFIHTRNFTDLLQDTLLGALTAQVHHMNALELSEILSALSLLKLTWNNINRLLRFALITGLYENLKTISANETANSLIALADLQAILPQSQEMLVVELFNHFFKLLESTKPSLKETEQLPKAYSYLKFHIQQLADDKSIELKIKDYQEKLSAIKHHPELKKTSVAKHKKSILFSAVAQTKTPSTPPNEGTNQQGFNFVQ